MLPLTVAELVLHTIIASPALPDPEPSLLQSMPTYGLFHLIDVRLQPDGAPYPVHGCRRLVAARQLAWPRIPALAQPAEAATLPADQKAILINTQRKSMSQLHVARRVRRFVPILWPLFDCRVRPR